MSSEAQQEQVSQERELTRLRYALKEIKRQAEIALHHDDAVRHQALRNILDRTQWGLFPPDDATILQEWNDGEISEGMAANMLGLTLLDSFEMLRE